MGEIRKDNLHESLIEELNELRNIDLSGKQDKTDESLLTESKTVIGAINELFQNANNGKELIATAIGEPLTAEDTFSAMSTGINGLLTTFKTNMMNNGITVESGDKFKSLIDKIATMVEEGSGKGIQFAEGLISNTYTINTSQAGSSNTIKLNLNGLTFKPKYLFLEMSNIRSDYSYDNTDNHPYTILSNIYTFPFYMNAFHDMTVSITSFSEKDCVVRITVDNTRYNLYATFGAWYAIGVGEEDTTLRDSLASILQDEGVSVTPEDDMSSLITKVDSEFDRQVVPAGNAVASDVLSGKTFINNTGQIITGSATVASLGGKRFANGTGTVTANGSSFKQLIVTGLPFRPRIVFVQSQSAAIRYVSNTDFGAIYVRGDTGAAGYFSCYNTDTTDPSTLASNIKKGNSYMGPNWFGIYVVDSVGASVNWIAWE